jgi:hypothetical protein
VSALRFIRFADDAASEAGFSPTNEGALMRIAFSISPQLIPAGPVDLYVPCATRWQVNAGVDSTKMDQDEAGGVVELRDSSAEGNLMDGSRALATG